MARKTFEPHPDIRSGRVGLAVMENMLHYGHFNLATQMRLNCDTAVVAFGSSQLHGVPGHPFSPDQKMAIAEGMYGPDQLKFLALQDIDASLNTNDWWEYVEDRVRKNSLPLPTDYFCGSPIDAKPYQGFFASLDDPRETNGMVTTYTSPRTGRRLHIIDRSVNPSLSGRQVRYLIESRDPEWMKYVPPRLWRYVEQHYPPHLRVALRGDAPPEDVPVGTRFIRNGDADGTVLVLRADGKWRPDSGRADEKAAFRR